MVNQARTSGDLNESDRSSNKICCCCPCCKVAPPTATRIRYICFLLVVYIICLLSLIPNIKEKLEHSLPFCKTHLGKQLCNNVTGYAAVYRLSFVVGLFFFLLSVLLMGVRTIDDQRAQLHHGYWIIKTLLFSGK